MRFGFNVSWIGLLLQACRHPILSEDEQQGTVNTSTNTGRSNGNACEAFCLSQGLVNCKESICNEDTNECEHLYWKNATKGEVCLSSAGCPKNEPVSCEHAQLTGPDGENSRLIISSTESGIHYTLVKHLGSGYCNDARLAISSDSGESVVLKCLRNINDGNVCGFEAIPAEFDRHKQYLDLGIPVPNAMEHFVQGSPKRQCLVMSLVGESLENYRKRLQGQMPLNRVASIGLAMVNWARKAHAGGISHSDMHVGNVAFSRAGSMEDLVLIDLGSTRDLPARDPRLTDEIIQKDAIYIAHTLMYLFTGERMYWHVKYRYEKAAELPMKEIERRFTELSGNAILLFHILEHAMTQRTVNWDYIVHTLECMMP